MAKGKKKSSKSKIIVQIIVFCALPVALVGGSLWLLGRTLSDGTSQVQDAYNDAKKNASDNAYNNIYQISFDNAERKYHVRNDVFITIGDMEEKADLEVLNVSDVVFIIRDAEDNGGITSWAEFPGAGTFTVNLKDAEFIIDNDRNHVLARVPEPELSRCDIQFKNVKLLLREDGQPFRNGTTVEGEEEADRDTKEAQRKLRNSFLENSQYLGAAEESAKSLIIESIKGLNSDDEDLIVDVEFTDNFS